MVGSQITVDDVTVAEDYRHITVRAAVRIIQIKYGMCYEIDPTFDSRKMRYDREYIYLISKFGTAFVVDTTKNYCNYNYLR